MPGLFAQILRAADVELDVADDYALTQAAAAAGSVMATAMSGTSPVQIVQGLRNRLRGTDLIPWQPLNTKLGITSASRLASTWTAYGTSARLGLDIDALKAFDMPIETVTGAFMRDAVPDGSVTLIDHDLLSPKPKWDWPLTIGVLATSAGLDIASKLSQQSLVRRGLARAVVLGQDSNACDVLLLSDDLLSAVSYGKLATGVLGSASATVVLGGVGATGQPVSMLRGLRDELRSDAAVVTNVDRFDLAVWTDSLLREISHDLPFDLALRRAGFFDRGRATVAGESPNFPLLVTGPELLNYSRISQQTVSLARRLRDLPIDTALRLPQYVRNGLGWRDAAGQAASAIPAAAMADHLVTQSLPYLRESDGATVSAVIAARVDEAEAGPSVRFTDLTLSKYDLRAQQVGADIADDDPLQGGSTYVLGVAFRKVRKGVGVNDKREPVQPIGEGATELLVTVTAMTEGRDPTDCISVAEPAQYLHLPAQGDSDEARFLIEVAKGTSGRFALEVRVFERLNIIEFLVLGVSVSAYGPARIVQHVEHRELGKRLEPRAVHLHVSKNDGGSYRIAVTVERSAGSPVRAEASTRIIGTGQLETELGKVRDFWIECALDQFGKDSLTAKDGIRDNVLTQLAEIGDRLWSILFRSSDQGGALDSVGRFLAENAPPPGAVIQVTLETEAQDFIFPWSLLYPENPAKPEPEALWGLRYVIEQQILSKVLRPKPAAAQPKAQSVALLFGLFDNFLQSAAQRKMIEDLAVDSGGKLDPGAVVVNPKELIARLHSSEAELVYFFSHGYTPFRYQGWLDPFREGLKKRPNDDAAESILKVLSRGDFVQNDAWIELTQGTLRFQELNREAIYLTRRPIVFLNMCRSAQLLPGLLQSFIWLFLIRAQVRCVLGTECPVSPALADLVGREMLLRIFAGVPVGQALYEVRRHVFGHYGNPLGLAYTLWGSAEAGVEALLAPSPSETAIAAMSNSTATG